MTDRLRRPDTSQAPDMQQVLLDIHKEYLERELERELQKTRDELRQKFEQRERSYQAFLEAKLGQNTFHGSNSTAAAPAASQSASSSSRIQSNPQSLTTEIRPSGHVSRQSDPSGLSKKDYFLRRSKRRPNPLSDDPNGTAQASAAIPSTSGLRRTDRHQRGFVDQVESLAHMSSGSRARPFSPPPPLRPRPSRGDGGGGEIQLLRQVPTPHVSPANQSDPLARQIQIKQEEIESRRQLSSFIIPPPPVGGYEGVVLNTIRLQCTEPDCRWMFDTMGDLHRHLHRRHNLYRFRCVHAPCGRSFKNRRLLGRHSRDDHHGLKQWECPHCIKAYTTAQALHGHVYSYHWEGVFKCAFPGCEHVCQKRGRMQAHFNREHRR